MSIYLPFQRPKPTYETKLSYSIPLTIYCVLTYVSISTLQSKMKLMKYNIQQTETVCYNQLSTYTHNLTTQFYSTHYIVFVEIVWLLRHGAVYEVRWRVG